jgi:hypothetical protein
MSFFEYLANNLVYLFIVIGALILVIGAGISKFFIIKKWKQVENSKKSESAIEQSESSTSGDENRN